MKVLYLKPYVGEEALVTTGLPDHECIFADALESVAPEVLAEVQVVSVFVDYTLTKERLQQLPSLQLIATRSAGYDHIDTAFAAEQGIVISRVPHYGTRTVAEFAFALMFALSRNAYRSYTDVQRESGTHAFERYEGFDLAGKTLGVIGTGAIGRSACEIGVGLGMNVLASDVHEDHAWAESAGVTYAPMEEVLGAAKIISLHVPSLPATRHLINQERLALMQPGSYLINTARGEIVDTTALVAALRSGQIAGAGLDVLEGEHELREEADLLTKGGIDTDVWETLVADHALIDMPNVIVTPHIAFNTVEAKQEITNSTVSNISSFVAGAPKNTV